MRLLCRAAFNASPPTTHPTEAQLYREAARRSGLQAFDEMESLRSGGGDKDRLATLIAVLNVGFEQGGAVSRQEKRAERFVEVLHDVYAPRILAGIAGLKERLEDRSLTLVMFRRRFWCTAREAAGLAELLLALEASAAVVAHYEGEAHRIGIAVVVERGDRIG